eukprot:TRINITY_DN64170_c0_g1_i1.p1 TRINITY_DN64170_c0_g1~~TRINITY_DN64170_c0_g1_i1.p1  ORF type:complete len:357 (-),score=71.36 TRINITY_DN64170_c0_g1_i1:144-1214(-)
MVTEEKASAAARGGMEAALDAALGGLSDALELTGLLALRRTAKAFRAVVRPVVAVRLTQMVVRCPATERRAGLLDALARVAAGGWGLGAASDLAADHLLSDFRVEVRRAAGRLLVATTSREQTDASRKAAACLSLALSDGDERVATAAAAALPQLIGGRGAPGAQAAAEAVASCLRRHRAPAVRQSAAAILAKLAERGDQKAVAALSSAASEDSEWRVRAQAARGLPAVVERGDTTALEALRRCLRDNERVVRQVAQAAIVHVSNRPTDDFLHWAPVPMQRGARRLVLQGPADVSPPRKKPRSGMPSSSPAAVVAAAAATPGARPTLCGRPLPRKRTASAAASAPSAPKTTQKRRR